MIEMTRQKRTVFDNAPNSPDRFVQLFKSVLRRLRRCIDLKAPAINPKIFARGSMSPLPTIGSNPRGALDHAINRGNGQWAKFLLTMSIFYTTIEAIKMDILYERHPIQELD